MSEEFKVKPFEELVELAANDMPAFEAYQRAVIEDFILGLPEEKQERARGLQWRIDQELAKYRDPTARMNRMVEMMWSSFFDLHSALNGHLDERKPPVEPLGTEKVTYVEFGKNDRGTEGEPS